MVEITNRKELEAWLEDQPREVAVAIAARAAWRVVPLFMRLVVNWPDKRNLDDDVQSWFRCILTPGVAVVYPTPEIGDAVAVAAATASDASVAGYDYAVVAYSVYAAAETYAFSGVQAADAAAKAVYAVAYAADFIADGAPNKDEFVEDSMTALWKTVSTDCASIERGVAPVDLFASPVWESKMPVAVANFEQDFAAWLQGGPLAFWARLYEDVRDGKRLNFEMLRDIALIPDEDWQKGAAHMASLIAEVEGRYEGDGPDDRAAIEQERERSGDALRQHVQRLIGQAKATEINAVGLAWQIKSAINAHCNNNADCGNEIPDELKPFDAIAGVLAKIGKELAQSELAGRAKEKTAEELEVLVAELQLRIKQLEQELKASKEKQVAGLIKAGFYRSLGTQISLALTSGVVGAATYIVAPEFSGEIAGRIGDWFTGQFEEPSIVLPQITSES